MTYPTVLLVEDDDHIRAIVAGYLENERFRVLEAVSGRTALQIMDRESPDLILLDILLPDMSGFEVCEEIRISNDVPIVIMSGRMDADDIILGFELGADDYITKPFDPQVLVMRVKARLLRNRMAACTGAAETTGEPAVRYAGLLTSREAEIVTLMERGFTNEEIAQQLSLTVGTVKWFNSQIFAKLGVKSRMQAVAKLREMGRVAVGRLGDPIL
ncbi:response regulator transcription factor [Cohnella sp. CFH 77786]|uniref:response regulator transcription factor n=1 Tax=Cohnella sp. CFH 77786 TaxID=2662265 RepID=UPI001C60C16A|nr:response regulator transcription factor [Cohnella sp. CFH 77786]